MIKLVERNGFVVGKTTQSVKGSRSIAQISFAVYVCVCVKMQNRRVDNRWWAKRRGEKSRKNITKKKRRESLDYFAKWLLASNFCADRERERVVVVRLASRQKSLSPAPTATFNQDFIPESASPYVRLSQLSIVFVYIMFFGTLASRINWISPWCSFFP